MPTGRLLIFILFIVNTAVLQAQSVIQKSATDAFLITRMAEKFHVKPRAVDESFSNDVYNALLKKIDAAKILFTQDDIKQLDVFRLKLDKEINGKKTAFLQLLVNIYTDRLKQADTMADNLLKMPFKYTIAEKFTVQEDTTYPLNTAAMRGKLYKKFKYSVASRIALSVRTINDPVKLQKRIDSADVILRKKVLNSFKLYIQKELQYPGGIPQLLGNDYCKSIALCYDPHTEYMTMTDRETFESYLGKRNMVFGFNLDEDDDGNIKIDKLKPGSAAFKSGMMNKGDKIISIQWEGADAIDVSKASAGQIEDILGENNHAKATITIIKEDGTKRQVVLAKEKETDGSDDDRVKGYILKGAKTIGYISLPSFYEDWENKVSIYGCANDVAKEILKLKIENIDGLVLDIRFNGGGSVKEAVDLAGIFIDAGPVTLIKTREPKTYTMKDMNRGTIFDGPLTILVNGFSASASELLSGALQDYNRALIVGSTTYGKATGQSILPLDTTIDLEKNITDTTSPAYLKLCLSQFYRVTGNTAQFSGVVPDILLPDATEAYDKKERNEPHALPANKIEANKYYIPYKALPLGMLKEKATEYKNEEPYFSSVSKYINEKKHKPVKKDVSLKMDDLLKRLPETDLSDDDEDDDSDTLELNENKKENNFYTIQPNKYETERTNTNSDLKESDEVFIEYLSKDPYLRVAYRLMLLMFQ